MSVHATFHARLSNRATPQQTRGPTGASAATLDSATLFAEVARAMIVHGSVSRTQARIVGLAVEVIQGCDAADVMVLDSANRLRTVAYTSPSVYVAGLVQRHNRAGPSMAALASGRCVVDDYATDPRWPRLSAWASSNGFASTCVCPLATDRRRIGVLNLYSSHAMTFSQELLARATVFAAHAALAIDSVWVEIELSTAIAREQTTGQAVGMLMERHSLSGEGALTMILEMSRQLDITVLEAAARLVDGFAKPSASQLVGAGMTATPGVRSDDVSR